MKVIDSRQQEKMNAIRRRRECSDPECGYRWTTMETAYNPRSTAGRACGPRHGRADFGRANTIARICRDVTRAAEAQIRQQTGDSEPICV